MLHDTPARGGVPGFVRWGMPYSLEAVALARLEETRQAIGVSELARESEAIAGGRMSYDSPGSWANEACGLGLDGAVSDAELDRLVAWYGQRGSPARVEVAAHADPSLIAGLAARGFALRAFENVFALDLPAAEELDARARAALPPEVRIDPLDPGDAAAVDALIDVQTSGFPPRLRPDGSLGPIEDDAAALVHRAVMHPRTRSFLAIHAGRAIACGGQEIAPPISCLFGATTLPEFRRRGVQLALIAARLALARRSGCAIGVIHTRPGIATERNIRRLGGELAYTKVVLDNAPLEASEPAQVGAAASSRGPRAPGHPQAAAGKHDPPGGSE